VVHKILIIYGTSYGQTAKIATQMQAILIHGGYQVTVVNAAAAAAPPLDSFDAIVVGSSIIAHGHQKAVERFIRAQIGRLKTIPGAFYSVSASAASQSAGGRAAADRLRDEFLAKMGWEPQLRASIAGAVNYTRYNPFVRWYMKRASAKEGGSTDTSRDHEYTDWQQVQRFADDVARLVERSSADVLAQWEPLERAAEDSVTMGR
jgi:menaquinone-dependent protoporphyrinogen oxidase